MLECPHCDETCATDAIGGNHMQRWHHPPTFSYICNADMQFPICNINTIQFLIYARNSFQSFSPPYSTQLSDSRRFPNLWSKWCYLHIGSTVIFHSSENRQKYTCHIYWNLNFTLFHLQTSGVCSKPNLLSIYAPNLVSHLHNIDVHIWCVRLMLFDVFSIPFVTTTPHLVSQCLMYNVHIWMCHVANVLSTVSRIQCMDHVTGSFVNNPRSARSNMPIKPISGH